MTTYLEALLNQTVALRCSDLHLQAGERPRIRLQGELTEVDGSSALPAPDLESSLLELLEPEQRERLQDQGYLDFSHSSDRDARWRCHYYRQRTGLSAAFRHLAGKVPTLEELRLPSQVARLAHLRQGLVLVTGATGSGKTTTLAALLETINQTYRRNVMTIEDPIEYLHTNALSSIEQRAVGVHVPSFHRGVIDSLHQDPDVLVVGELRDYETVRAALTAAETGILVFATLHSNDVAQTIDRILDMFTHEEQQLVRIMLSHSLQAVVSQVLLDEPTGKGRIPACEIMFRTPAIAGMIRADKIHEVRNAIQTGRAGGMCVLDDSLAALVEQRRVTAEEAARFARHPRRFAKGRQEWFVGTPAHKKAVRTERRHEPRVRGLNLVNLTELDEVGLGTELTVGRTLDLSHEGVGIKLNHQLLIGSRVRLQLALENQVLEVQAIVRSSHDLHDGTYALGLRFDKLSPEDARTLDAYLAVHG